MESCCQKNEKTPLSQRWAIGSLRAYQRWLSPLFGPRCRFYPSCSHYAIDAINEWGMWRGCGLIIWRLLRCHPWHPGGIEFVPERQKNNKTPNGDV